MMVVPVLAAALVAAPAPAPKRSVAERWAAWERARERREHKRELARYEQALRDHQDDVLDWEDRGRRIGRAALGWGVAASTFGTTTPVLGGVWMTTATENCSGDVCDVSSAAGSGVAFAASIGALGISLVGLLVTGFIKLGHKTTKPEPPDPPVALRLTGSGVTLRF